MNLVRLVLATLRLTRLSTTDTLGEWAFVGPAKKWAHRHESPADLAAQATTATDLIPDVEPANGPRSKLVSGLDCPHCVGFWIGTALLLGETICVRHNGTYRVWQLVTSALALSYVTGHTAQRLDEE